jgi:hypothetical protein
MIVHGSWTDSLVNSFAATINYELSSMNQPTLIVIAGPTASGKTAAAIQLAQHFNTVVVSADSRQFFREMSIGTAKPTAEELAAAPHYFINSHSITESFSVGDFEREGLVLLEAAFPATPSGYHWPAARVCTSRPFAKASTICLLPIPPYASRLNDELSEKGHRRTYRSD